MRVALYWAPERDDPLWAAGTAWLGRDPELGVAVAQPALPGIGAVTAAARLYGFHATLRPPMRLATGWDEFLASAEGLASGMPPFDLPALMVDDLDGFLALRERAPCPALHALADACVRVTDAHRLAAPESELAKRREAGLSDEEEALLQRWGYPYVMQRWRFHVTLTRRLDAAEMAGWRPAAEAHFADVLALPRKVMDLAVFTQGAADAPFLVAHRFRLGR